MNHQRPVGLFTEAPKLSTISKKGRSSFSFEELYRERRHATSGDVSNQIDFGTLQKMTNEELLVHANDGNIPQPEALDRQELIYQVLRSKLLSSGMLYGEGTLEILNDGFGFLRSTSHHYLSCTYDIYISPSQIRRFGLTTGMTISGQIRPPKENERYFALLRVEAINHRNPNESKARKPFDSLTPVHPKNRIVLETTPIPGNTSRRFGRTNRVWAKRVDRIPTESR